MGPYDLLTATVRGRYRSGNWVVNLLDEDGQVYAMATRNVCGVTCADENNLPGISEWLEAQGIARRTGEVIQSGCCTYPVLEML